MNSLSTPTSANLPASAPEAAPTINPSPRHPEDKSYKEAPEGSSQGTITDQAYGYVLPLHAHTAAW